MMSVRARRLPLALAAALLAGSLTGCISMKSYVDPTLPALAKGQLPAVADPRPVTVLFEFRSKGNSNARGTDELQGRVIAAVAESGMFGRVRTTMDSAPSGVLKLVIDDQADTGKAVAKGFGTGLTFGLVGSMVTDQYTCTASYTFAGRTTATAVHDSMFTTVGNHDGPAGLTAMQPMEAVNQIVDQLVWHSLVQLDQQSAFAAPGQ
jgi:hypothetical protein